MFTEPHRTPSEVACALLSHGFLGDDATGVAIAARCLPEQLWFLATAGYLGTAHAGRTLLLNLDVHAPMPRAVLTEQPIPMPDRSAMDQQFPLFAALVPAAEAAIALPTIHDGRTIGAVGITYATPQAFCADSIRALTAVAASVAEVCLVALT